MIYRVYVRNERCLEKVKKIILKESAYLRVSKDKDYVSFPKSGSEQHDEKILEQIRKIPGTEIQDLLKNKKE